VGWSSCLPLPLELYVLRSAMVFGEVAYEKRKTILTLFKSCFIFKFGQMQFWQSKIFSPKKLRKNWRFWLITKLNYAKILIITLFLRKRQFFRRKLAKIAENCDRKLWSQFSAIHNIDPWSVAGLPLRQMHSLRDGLRDGRTGEAWRKVSARVEDRQRSKVTNFTNPATAAG
jgi:hypothetical protein